MKKTISIILAAVLALGCILGFAACSSGSKGITIAVPHMTLPMRHVRLLLLQEQGIIKLKDGAGHHRNHKRHRRESEEHHLQRG